MSSKIRIKIGAVEVEYEGTEEFLKKELPELLAAVAKLYRTSATTPDEEGDLSAVAPTSAAAKMKGTTGSIAAKLGAGSGSGLIMAAAARLTFVSKQESFTRKQLLDEMKSASGYYRKTYRDNLSSYLKNLVKDRQLVEEAAGRYSVPANARAELRKKIA